MLRFSKTVHLCLLPLLPVFIFYSCSSYNFTYKVINSYPHDRSAFTQGLAFADGVLYEGTGLRGLSTLRKVELETGDILQIRKIPNEEFGEGITIYEDKIIQLTWQSNLGYVYDRESFELISFHITICDTFSFSINFKYSDITSYPYIFVGIH